MVVKAKPEYEKANKPKEAWRIKIWNFINSDPFEFTIMGAIVLNMI